MHATRSTGDQMIVSRSAIAKHLTKFSDQLLSQVEGIVPLVIRLEVDHQSGRQFLRFNHGGRHLDFATVGIRMARGNPLR
ncbi:MAG: hypothetical protein IPG32_13030 [Saprospirales bacterium]|nr:hypothetical protein [Saprospirales bacterium]